MVAGRSWNSEHQWGSLGLHWDVLLSLALGYELGLGDQAKLCLYKTLFSVLLSTEDNQEKFNS